MLDSVLLVQLLGILLGSSLLGVFITNALKREFAFKELIANAIKSALRRAEMYYRIRRRTDDTDDLKTIRDEFHDIQQENDYYAALLLVESRWYGGRYKLFLRAIERESGSKINAAFKLKHGPNIEIKHEERPHVDTYTEQFIKDSRRLLNPATNPWMGIRDSTLITNIFPVKAYDERKI